MGLLVGCPGNCPFPGLFILGAALKKSFLSPVAVIILVAFIGLASYLLVKPPQEKEGSLTMQREAWDFIMETVRQEAGAAGSLQFPHTGYEDVTHLGNNRYQATSYVEVIAKPGEKERRYFNITVILTENDRGVELLKFAR